MTCNCIYDFCEKCDPDTAEQIKKSAIDYADRNSMPKEYFNMHHDGLEFGYKEGAHEFTKRLKNKYAYVCKTCNGPGEISIPQSDGSHMNEPCPDCIGYTAEKVWKEAIDFLDRNAGNYCSCKEDSDNMCSKHAQTYCRSLLEEEGKRKGYINE